MNREMVYQSDLTGSQARLLQTKDKVLGTTHAVVVDRVDLPVVLFYTNGPFKIMDFEAKKGRIPVIEYMNPTILLTKSGRFANTLPNITDPAQVVATDGDYMLYFFDSQQEIDTEKLAELKKNLLGTIEGTQEYIQITSQILEIEKRISSGVFTLPQ